MATLPTSTKLKIDSTIMQCIPILKGQFNYSIWKTCVQSALQAYSVFEFVDGSLLYTTMTSTADQQKWKMLDCHVFGFIAGIISNSLTTHVNYDWEDQATCPSVFKAFWEKNSKLSLGLPGQLDNSICSTRPYVHRYILILLMRISALSCSSSSR